MKTINKLTLIVSVAVLSCASAHGMERVTTATPQRTASQVTSITDIKKPFIKKPFRTNMPPRGPIPKGGRFFSPFGRSVMRAMKNKGQQAQQATQQVKRAVSGFSPIW